MIPWRRARQPTPVSLPGESHGQRSLVGCSPQGCTESDTTEATLHTHVHAVYMSMLFSVWSGSHHVASRGYGFLHKASIAFPNEQEGSGHGPHPTASELLASTSPCFSRGPPHWSVYAIVSFPFYLPENLYLLLDESIGTCSFIWQLILRGGKNQIHSKFTVKLLKMSIKQEGKPQCCRIYSAQK